MPATHPPPLGAYGASLPARRAGGGKAPSIRWAVVPLLAQVRAKRPSRQAPFIFFWQVAGKGAAVGSDRLGWLQEIDNKTWVVGIQKNRESPIHHPVHTEAQQAPELSAATAPPPTRPAGSEGAVGDERSGAGGGKSKKMGPLCSRTPTPKPDALREAPAPKRKRRSPRLQSPMHPNHARCWPRGSRRRGPGWCPRQLPRGWWRP